MLQIAVCDDEPVMCHYLKEMLTTILDSLKEPFAIACYTNSSKLLNSATAYDLLFLDIQMPGFDGMETARQLRERMEDCILIFVTVLKDCMSKAFEVEAFDYLLKPIDREQLSRTLTRALKRLKRRRKPRLFVSTLNQCCLVDFDAIFYCEVINRKLYLHTRDGVIDYYGKMEEIEKQLDSRFFRCHRSYLVNLDYLKSYNHGQLLLTNGSQIPVSRLRHQEFMHAMLKTIRISSKNC